MPLFLVAAIASIAGPASAVAVQTPAQPGSVDQARQHCPQTTSIYAYKTDKAVTPKKLTDLPAANAYSAVLRRIGGCEVPIVVRYGVGGGR